MQVLFAEAIHRNEVVPTNKKLWIILNLFNRYILECIIIIFFLEFGIVKERKAVFVKILRIEGHSYVEDFQKYLILFALE